MKSAPVLLPPVSEVFRGAVVGKSGTGKGNTAKAWVEEQMRSGRRVVVADPEDEWSASGPASKVITRGPCVQRLTFEQFAQSPLVLDDDRLSLAVVLSEDPDAAADEAAELCELVMATGELLLVLEEVGGYAFEGQNSGTARKAINFVATRGRHRGVNPLLISQRLTHLPKTTRGQINALQVFCQTDPDDLRELDKLTAPEIFSERVASQRAGESLLWLDPLMRSAKAHAKEEEK